MRTVAEDQAARLDRTVRHFDRRYLDRADRLVVEQVDRIDRRWISGIAGKGVGEAPLQYVEHMMACVAGNGRAAPVHDRAGLNRDSEIDGPALIIDPVSTTVVEPGWRARVDAIGNLILTRHQPRPAPQAADADGVDPVRL